jgi:hypothetical protein
MQAATVMDIIPTWPPFLASATGNTIKDKAVINTSVGKATNDNSIKESLIKPTTKSMRKKLKAREMKAKKERAPVAAKAAKAKATFKATPFVIATDGTATKSTAPVGSATTVKDNILVASDASKFVHTSDTVAYITIPTSHLLEVTDELLPASNGSVPTLSDPGEDSESALESTPGSEDEGDKDKNSSSFSDAGLTGIPCSLVRCLDIASGLESAITCRYGRTCFA